MAFGKKKRSALQDQMSQQSQQANSMLLASLNKPKSELETLKEKEQTDWLRQTNSPDFDITKTTGMSPYMNLYNRAKSQSFADETPMPTAATWGGTPNAALGQALSAQGSRSREQEAAGGLQAAFAGKDAAMRGDTMPFLALQQQRNMGLQDLLNNRSLGMTGLYERSIHDSPWGNFLRQLLLQKAGG